MYNNSIDKKREQAIYIDSFCTLCPNFTPPHLVNIKNFHVKIVGENSRKTSYNKFETGFYKE